MCPGIAEGAEIRRCGRKSHRGAVEPGARCGTTQTGVAEGGLEDLPHRDVTDQ